MSNTRRVEPGMRRRQNGFASAPEFDALRGINGTAVALKASLLKDSKQRELLYFLQRQSLREDSGGTNGIAAELLEMFPDRVGEDDKAPEIIERRVKKAFLQAATEEYGEREPEPKRDEADAIEYCREQANENLGAFIEQLCCDPEIQPHSAAVPYFKNIVGALLEYQRRCIQAAQEAHIQTGIGREVFEICDYVLDTKRPALIEGESGIGKSHNLKAWCELYPGRVRYVDLNGINHRTEFFTNLARVFGVAKGGGLSSGKIQIRVEEFLLRSKMIPIMDEGQYLWPGGKRIESHPELINWLNTACYNHGIPYIISATSEFTARRQAVEAATTWSSEQLKRRLRRVLTLPAVPQKRDLEKVACGLLEKEGLRSSAAEKIVGYALTSKGYFQAIVNVVDDARLLAMRDSREHIAIRDIDRAINEWRAPSDAALLRICDSEPKHRSNKRPEINESLNRAEPPVIEVPNRGMPALVAC